MKNLRTIKNSVWARGLYGIIIY